MLSAARRRWGQEQGQALFGMSRGEIKLFVDSRAKVNLLVGTGDR